MTAFLQPFVACALQTLYYILKRLKSSRVTTCEEGGGWKVKSIDPQTMALSSVCLHHCDNSYTVFDVINGDNRRRFREENWSAICVVAKRRSIYYSAGLDATAMVPSEFWLCCSCLVSFPLITSDRACSFNIDKLTASSRRLRTGFCMQNNKIPPLFLVL